MASVWELSIVGHPIEGRSVHPSHVEAGIVLGVACHKFGHSVQRGVGSVRLGRSKVVKVSPKHPPSLPQV